MFVAMAMALLSTYPFPRVYCQMYQQMLYKILAC